MNNYAKVAIKTVNYLNKYGGNPVTISDKVANELFEGKMSSIKKGCPKSAFLGLCEEGLVKGIEKGSYTKSIKNKEYVLKAIELIRDNESIIYDKKLMWEIVASKEKAHNSQMDIVCELWKANLIYR